jgi:hypothetical protein
MRHGLAPLIGFPLIKSATFLARMSKYQFPALPRLGTHALPEFLCLHLDCIHVETGNVDVARVQTVWRQTAWFKAGTAVVQFIAAPMRQRKGGITAVATCQRVRKVGQPMGDKMDDLALALDAAVDRHHPGRKDYAALPFIEF